MKFRGFGECRDDHCTVAAGSVLAGAGWLHRRTLARWLLARYHQPLHHHFPFPSVNSPANTQNGYQEVQVGQGLRVDQLAPPARRQVKFTLGYKQALKQLRNGKCAYYDDR
jgi:hypothetical protein